MKEKNANHIEEGVELKLDFEKIRKAAAVSSGLIPVAVQDADTDRVILLAYTNELAFKEAVKSRRLILWSASRDELWEKGKTSGETFDLIEVYVNCEQNSLLYKVRPRRGGICHTKNNAAKPRDCFYRKVDLSTLRLENTDP